MENLILKLRDFLKDDLFANNRAAAYARNKRVLRTVLFASIGCHILLLAVSFISQAYVVAQLSYIVCIILFSIFIILLHFCNDTVSTIFAYIIHFLFLSYCTYNSAFVWSDDICVMIIAETFIISTLILDKAWRVFGITIISNIIYLVVISHFKDSYHFVDEFVNIVCFTLLGCIVGTFTRRTQLKNFDSIEKLRLSRERYELAMKHSAGMVCEFDVAQKCLIMTEEVAAVFNVAQKVYNVPYAPVKDGVISSETSVAYINFYEEIMAGSKTGVAEFESLTSDGWHWQKAHFSTLFDNNNNPVSAVISFIDITQQREEQDKLKNEAEKDGMTGVYNRKAAEALIKQLLPNKAEKFVFLIADVDNLKTINDTLGHPYGDEAIISLANTMTKYSRDDDIVGRIGGDEFIALLCGFETKEQIEDNLNHFLGSLKEICIGGKKELHLSASVGVVFVKSKNATFKDLYVKADKALYVAKQNGKGTFSIFTE